MYWLGRSPDRTPVTQTDLDSVFSALEVPLGCSLTDRTQFLGGGGTSSSAPEQAR